MINEINASAHIIISIIKCVGPSPSEISFLISKQDIIKMTKSEMENSDF
jgi:hypothetical protein